jgi:predicted O-methyltransferase YrrM
MNSPSLSGPWSIGEDAFTELVRDMTAVHPRSIVEFGSGASSIRLSQAFPDSQVLSIESSEEFFKRARDCARRHGVGPPRLRIALRPLRFPRIAGAVYDTYDCGPFPSRIDAVLIDGPPYWTGRGR